MRDEKPDPLASFHQFITLGSYVLGAGIGAALGTWGAGAAGLGPKEHLTDGKTSYSANAGTAIGGVLGLLAVWKALPD